MRNPALLLLPLLLLPVHLRAQNIPEREKVHLEVPEIAAFSVTELHMYVLSSSKGLVVFRNHSDSLLFLYESDGMQRRGPTLFTDIRFAYLINGNTVSVVEPTSILGVYSSTTLSHPVLKVLRNGSTLYAATGTGGLQSLTLESPDAFDKPARKHLRSFGNPEILDFIRSGNGMTVLTGEPSLLVLSFSGDSLAFQRKAPLDRSLHALLPFGQQLWAADAQGNLFQIASNGRTQTKGSVKEKIHSFAEWQGLLWIRTLSGSVWSIKPDGTANAFRKSGAGQNFIAVSKNRLWMTEFDAVSTFFIKNTAKDGSAGGQKPKLLPVDAAIIPYPRPFLAAVGFESGYESGTRLWYRSNTVNGMMIEGSGLFWQPSSRDIGRHSVTIGATNPAGQSDSTTFSIDVRPFNAPPRFAPLQPQTLAPGFEFTLPVSATDPDGVNPKLIRYAAVNLPDGASFDEKTGIFTWKPGEQHLGVHRFRVVASDQFGAAASIDVELIVRKANR